MKCEVRINKDCIISQLDRRLFGSFIEHLGRAVYGGIYEPDHPTADENGFRGDVLELVRELGVPIVRYPGGNFVSGYNWEDGVGEKALRPQKIELAWGTIETNEVGLDEFSKWAKLAGTEIMMAVNLGTRGADEARNLVEYANLDTPTYYAQMRRKNGFTEPFGINLWCLGNEMDGNWQICAQTPQEYARKARETAKVMKWVDDSIELVVCGSSNANSPTFGVWEEAVLRECYDYVDYLSLHNYYGNYDDYAPAYLASSLDMDKFIKRVTVICDTIGLERGSEKRINLAFDEWNIWFHSIERDKKIPRWSIAPPQLEDIYNLEDALVAGTLLITLINNCDRVKIACLAQLVNVIAPIMTENGGRVWKQTIFYPYLHALKYGRGTALEAKVICDFYTLDDRDVPFIEAACVYDEQQNELVIFAVNRSLSDTCELALSADFAATLIEHLTLTGDDLKATNSANEERVFAKSVSLSDRPILPKQSWNVLRYRMEEK